MNKPSLSWIVFGISLLLTGSWMLLVSSAKELFLNSRSADPLAMVHSLFPHFWLILLAFLCLCIILVVLSIDHKWLHVLLLLEISLILYYTPWILSGFSVNPDTLWHTSIGISIPDVLSGKKLMLTDYGKAYPLSYILTNILSNVTGADVFTYSLSIYPVFGAIAVSLLGYTLASKFLDCRNAFVSMLFALPAMHYFQLNVSPRFAGFALTMAIMVFILRFERKAMAIAFSLMFPLIFMHTSSPLALATFLLAIYIYKLFTRDTKLPFTSKSILVLCTGWVGWLLFYAILSWKPIENVFSRVITLQFSKGLERAIFISTPGSGFIYREISALNQIIYIGYLAIAIIPLFFNIIRYNIIHRPKMHGKETLLNLSYKKLVPIIATFLFIILSYGLLLGIQRHDQLQRGLAFFVLMVSICIGSHDLLSRNTKLMTYKRILATMWLLFVLFSFPLISYSKEAYNTFPPSEGVGMNFIASHIRLNGKRISMDAKQQLIAFVNPSEYFSAVEFPPNLNKTQPDIVVLRNTAFFERAMRYDLSFDTNEFTQLQGNIEQNSWYNKVYSSTTFEIYKHQERPESH